MVEESKQRIARRVSCAEVAGFGHKLAGIAARYPRRNGREVYRQGPCADPETCRRKKAVHTVQAVRCAGDREAVGVSSQQILGRIFLLSKETPVRRGCERAKHRDTIEWAKLSGNQCALAQRHTHLTERSPYPKLHPILCPALDICLETCSAVAQYQPRATAGFWQRRNYVLAFTSSGSRKDRRSTRAVVGQMERYGGFRDRPTGGYPPFGSEPFRHFGSNRRKGERSAENADGKASTSPVSSTFVLHLRTYHPVLHTEHPTRHPNTRTASAQPKKSPTSGNLISRGGVCGASVAQALAAHPAESRMASRLAFAFAANSLPVRNTPIHHATRQLLTMSARPEVVCLDCTGTIMRIKGSMPRCVKHPASYA